MVGEKEEGYGSRGLEGKWRGKRGSGGAGEEEERLGRGGWMNGVLGHFYALSRLNWARGQPGLMR